MDVCAASLSQSPTVGDASQEDWIPVLTIATHWVKTPHPKLEEIPPLFTVLRHPVKGEGEMISVTPPTPKTSKSNFFPN